MDEAFDKIRAALLRAFRNGTAIEDVEKRLKPILRAQAWWIEQVTVVNPRTTRKNTLHPGSVRLECIYETYLKICYGADSWASAQRTKAMLPLLRYVSPKCEKHMRWDCLVLSVDDTWWQIFHPPNGWSCTCYADSLSERDLERLSASMGVAPEATMHEWVSPFNGKPVRLPEGIDPGFYGLPSVTMADSLLKWWLVDPEIGKLDAEHAFD